MKPPFDFHAKGWIEIRKPEALALIAATDALGEPLPNGVMHTAKQTLGQKLGGREVKRQVCFAAKSGTYWRPPP